MANIFAILTAVVLAIAAFLAFKNKGDKATEGAGYQGWITKRENEEQALARKEGEYKSTVDTLKKTEGTLAEVNDSNTGLEEEVKTQKEKNEQLETLVGVKQAEAEAKEAEVTRKKDDLKAFGDIDQVLADLDQMNRDLAQISADITEREAQRASLESQIKTLDGSIDGVQGQITRRNSGKSDPNLRTRVRSVYSNHAFVTLAGGDNLGIVKDSMLDVVRDGEVVGKLQVTTVETSTAAADVVPDSFAEGDNVRGGDLVTAATDETPKAVDPDPAG